MQRFLATTVALALLLVCGRAAEPPIRFPAAPKGEPTTPAPVDRLTAGRFYVVDSDVELFVKAVPDGLVEQHDFAGPMTFFAKFADGGPREEKREYKGKFLYVFTAAKDGQVTLVVVPKGVTDKASIVTKALRVESGQGPQPPPGPGPGPGPKPTPDDPLFKPMAEAYAKAKDPASLDKLLKVYRAAAVTDLAIYPTAGALYSALRDQVRTNALADADLRLVREVIQKELANFLPAAADVALTQDHRANAKSTFARIVTCLEALRE